MSTGKGAMGYQAPEECHGCERPIRGAAQTYGALVLCVGCMQAFAADKAAISKQIGRWLAPVEWEPIGSGLGASRLRRDPEWWMLTLTPEQAGRMDSPRQWREPEEVAVPLPAKPYASVERVSARTIRAQAEGSARYQRLIAWLPPARMITASEVAGELGCSPSQAGRAIRRGIAEGRIRAWPSQGFSSPGFLRPPTVADRIVAFLEKHGEGRVADIVAGIGLDCKRVNSAAKSDHRIEQVGRGVLRVRR